MAKEKLTENVTEGGRKRWRIYLLLFLVLAGVIVATLISFNVISQDQFDAWVVQVGITVPALLGMGGTLLALLNPEKKKDDVPPAVDRRSVM